MKKSLILIFCFLALPFSCIIAQTYAEQYDKCRKLYNITDSTSASVLETLLNNMDSCLVGSIAPNFRSRALDGNFVELSRLKGRIVILNFWAIGCSPCIKELPQLNRLAKLYSGKVIFVSLADDKPGSLKKFLKKHPVDYPIIANSNRIMTETFKLMSVFPYSIIIDKEGKIFKMRVGGFGSEKEMIPYYKSLIEKIFSLNVSY